MAYKRKTYDEYQLFGNCGYGWYYILAEATYKEAKEQLRTYVNNAPSEAYKIVKRRIKRA